MNRNALPAAHGEEDFLVHEFDKVHYSSNILNSLILPRPIAFITTLGENGVINAAPFSYFNIACTKPAIVSIAIERREGRPKDTSHNIMTNKEFVVNICSQQIAKAISIASDDFPRDISEIELTKLSLVPSHVVSPPRVANTLAQLECRLHQVVELGDDPTDLILGRVVKVHIHKSLINAKGRICVETLNPLARLSGTTYAGISNLFDIPRGL
jgi:flavin reductase (DIM6/NTAB) family NADH-FMN oxidoreductase RutF